MKKTIYLILSVLVIGLAGCSGNGGSGGDDEGDDETYTLTMAIEPANSGSVIKNPDQANYAMDADITLIPTPENGYQFKQWTGSNGAEVTDNQIIMDDNKNITAVFEEETTGTVPLTDEARRFTVDRTFNGTPDVKTSLESDGFNDAGGRSVYSSEQAYSGTTSCKMTVLTTDSESQGGSGGWGRWGGIINVPNKIYKGDELFIRLRMYYPSGFNHYTSGGGGRVKFLRIRSMHADDSNGGFIDVYWDNETSGTTLKFIKEGVHKWHNVSDSTDYPHLFDQWITFNVHYILSDDPAEGRVRIWQNNDLLIDKAVATLTEAEDYAENLYLFTYWNGEVPQDQSCYVDDIKLTSDSTETVIHSDSGLRWIGQ